MQFGLFGSASARRGGAEFDSSEGFRDFIDYNVEAEALGFHSTFVVEHHFTGYGQVSATLNLLTWVGARTRRLRRRVRETLSRGPANSVERVSRARRTGRNEKRLQSLRQRYSCRAIG
jgi:Luciferase-like monooxygenase